MTLNETSPAPLAGLTLMIERHGTLTVALAFLRAALTPRPRVLPVEGAGLSPHLRRDLGLPPWGEGPPIR